MLPHSDLANPRRYLQMNSYNNPSETVSIFSIVVPVYKSGQWLNELVTRVAAAMHPLGAPFEIILVNDASPDTVTWPAIEALAARYPWVHGFDMLYNVGQFRATICGLENANGTYVITMDDDLQHPPEELPKMIEHIHANPDLDCVFGRYDIKQHSWLRNAGSKFIHQIMNKLYAKPADVDTTSFRIMKRGLVQTILAYRIAQPQLGPIIVTLTKKVANVTVSHAPCLQRSSNYRLGHLISMTFRSVINASIAPLRWVSLIGFASAVGSTLLGCIIIWKKITGGIALPGFSTLVLTTCFFGGMILLSVGILGEYVGRVIQELTGPPRYMVRTSTKQFAPSRPLTD